MRTVIIDADKLVYSCAFACQKKRWFAEKNKHIWFEGNKKETDKFVKEQADPEAFTVDYFQDLEPISHCLYNINHNIQTICNAAGTDRYIVLLSAGEDTFRHRLATLLTYKGNRRDNERPVYYQEARQHLIHVHKAKVYNKWEADDAAVMALYNARRKGRDYVLAHVDKDLLQIPGLHLHVDRPHEGVYEVTETEAWQSFYTQMLTGDSSDNIPGLPRIGQVSAAAILSSCTTTEAMCRAVWHAYQDAFPMTANAYRIFRENADLLYMLRFPEDQYYPHCPELRRIWQPYPEGVVKHYLKD